MCFRRMDRGQSYSVNLDYLQAFAASVGLVEVLGDGLDVLPACCRWQSFAFPPEAPEFWPFMFLLAPPD
ncbi:hypothetical protein ASE04_18970 [Rhizobium sp. Root708]|nr:hypothetical protein ASE04_18970 [Rhizobium sp. Root708]